MTIRIGHTEIYKSIKTMTQKFCKVEVLKFRRGDNVATIATNGTMHVTKEYELMKEHRTLHHAIGYLEAKGFSVSTDEFESV